MPQSQVRTLWQIAVFILLLCGLIFFADTRYRVLPDVIHAHLLSHHPGSVITDVSIKLCSKVNPLSTCRLDPKIWYRVEKDLYLGAGWVNSAWLHVQRKNEEELVEGDKVVMDIRVSQVDPSIGEKGQATERWEQRSGGIWLLRSDRRQDSDSESAVTAVDVLFGSDAVDPRPNWNLARSALPISGGDPMHLPRLSVRHGQPKVDRKDAYAPRVTKAGKFKILQVSDAHLSTGIGNCRDAIGPNGEASKNCEADPRTLEFVEAVLDDEKPDMVVLSGDQVEGPSAPDTQTAIYKITAPLIERSIPYAAIFGNHDDEGSKSLARAAQMGLLHNLPFSLSEPGPDNVDGVGNYVVEVMASAAQHSALTLYMLDTHGLTPDEKHYKGYDWLKPSQVEWFRNTAASLKSSRTHTKYSHIHMDMAFIHIPIPEYADQSNLVIGGAWKEPVTAPGYNTHFYDALVEAGVVAVGCGHDHVNDYCAVRPQQATARDSQGNGANSRQSSNPAKRNGAMGPWMCYAGGSGFGGYGGYEGYHRRVRVWEVDTNAGRVMTWKRVECCGDDKKKRIDEISLVEGGHVVPPAQ